MGTSRQKLHDAFAQYTFSAAGFPHQAQRFPRVNIEGNVVHSLDPSRLPQENSGADGKVHFQIVYLQERFRHGWEKKKLKVGATGAGFHEVVRGYFHEGRAFREFFSGHTLPLAEAASGNEIRNRGHLPGNGGQFGFPHGT